MTNQRRQRRRVRRLRPALASAAAALAADWAWELSMVDRLRIGRTELELGLRGQVDILLRALSSDQFQPQVGAQVGAYLVSVRATGAEALRRTLLLLSERLPGDLPISPEAGRYRLTRLLVEIAAGWADARADPPAGGPAVPDPNPWFE